MRAILLQVEQSESNAQNFVRMHCVESRFMLYVMSMALVFPVTVYVAYDIPSNTTAVGVVHFHIFAVFNKYSIF